jgi:DNA-binding PadR family transcriptional regulator
MEKKRFTLKVKITHFEVLKCLQEGLNIKQISEYRKCSRVAIYKILKTLISRGLIEKVGYANYQLKEKGIEGLHSFVALRNKLRQHNLHFKISVLESPKNWELRRNEIRQMPYFNKKIKLKNNDQDLLNFGKLQIKTTTKSLIIKMPTIYSIDWEDAIIQAMSILEETIPKLESQFKIRLIKDYKANIKIISQEYAKIQDALANLYRSEGNRLYLTGDDGKIWLITDLSFSTDETEFIHPERATDDLDALAPFFNDIRKNPTTLSNMREESRQVLEVAKASMQNVVKHQKVLDEILITFRKINERLDKAGL